MSSNRGFVNKFSYILPYYEDYLCVLLWRDPKDMGEKAVYNIKVYILGWAKSLVSVVRGYEWRLVVFNFI